VHDSHALGRAPSSVICALGIAPANLEAELPRRSRLQVPLMGNGMPLEGAAAGERQLDFGSIHIIEKAGAKDEPKLNNVSQSLPTDPKPRCMLWSPSSSSNAAPPPPPSLHTISWNLPVLSLMKVLLLVKLFSRLMGWGCA